MSGELVAAIRRGLHPERFGSRWSGAYTDRVSAEVKNVLEQALALAEVERAVLADALTDSLRQNERDLSPEWLAEVTRRIEAVERGESHLIPGDEVEARLRVILGGV